MKRNLNISMARRTVLALLITSFAHQFLSLRLSFCPRFTYPNRRLQISLATLFSRKAPTFVSLLRRVLA
jgi:hypothetical protein